MINLELFSCAGGMAEGFRRAGVNFDLAFDSSPDACESYALNLHREPVRIDVRDLLRLARRGAFKPEVNLLVADPPCTPWSLSGKREGLADERDMLRQTCELIRLLRPNVFLVGNVPGLETESNIRAVQETIGALAGAGYCVRDFVVLDAADYGVPQHRRRPFWFGHLAGPCIRWPEPTHCDPRRPCLPGMQLEPWVSCAAALSHLPAKDLGRPVRVTIHRRSHKPSKRDHPSRTLTGNTHSDGALLAVDGASVLQFTQNHAPSSPTDPAKVIVASDGGGVSGGRSVAWPWDRPATTVTQREALGAPGHHDPEVRGHSGQFGPNAVVLSERAAAILQGFPETWAFVGKSKRARWAQIGQAMPPAVAEAVARSIARQQVLTAIEIQLRGDVGLIDPGLGGEAVA